MNFVLTEEQIMLKKTVRKFLENRCPTTFVREVMENPGSYSTEIWHEMAEMGLIGLNIPEEYDGIGLGIMDLVVVMEEIGRAILPAPYLETIMAAEAILLVGREDQKKEFLPKIASGEMMATLAIDEPTGHWNAAAVSAKAVREGNEYRINGTKLFVPYANVAGLVVCAVRTGEVSNSEDGITLILLDPQASGVEISLLSTMDETYRLYEIKLENVLVNESQVLGEVDRGWTVLEEVIQKAMVAISAESIGGSEKAMEIALKYAKERVQFGKVIGAFQAIKHKFANMLVNVENNRSAVYYAGWAFGQSKSEATLAASVAKAYSSETYYQTTSEAIQILGGIGYTWEHDMHLFLKRAKRLEVTFGNAFYHREQIAKSWLDSRNDEIV